MCWVFLEIGQESNGMEPLPRCSKCAFSKGKKMDFCTSDKKSASLFPVCRKKEHKLSENKQTHHHPWVLACFSNCLCDVWANGAEVPDINMP